jgi:hypothetical protein
MEMSVLSRLCNQCLDWIDGGLERRRVRKVSTYAGELEFQIREQLNQHHQTRLNAVRQEGFDEGVSRTRQTYQNEYDLLRAAVHTKEVIISELKASKVLTQKPKRTQRRKSSRKGK